MVSDYKYECTFCGAKFKLEQRFLDHRCKQMQRDEEIRTPIGQAAWAYYQLWLKLQRRAVPKIETFLESRYYATFVKFAKFAIKVGLPDPELFVKYMVQQDMTPMLWCHDDIDRDYIQYLDRRLDPTKAASNTITFIFKLADALDVEVGEIFDYLEPNDLIQMLTRRQLSPWILLHSGKFKQFLINKATDEQRTTISAIIKPEYWAEKKAKHPEIVAQMKKYVRELDL